MSALYAVAIDSLSIKKINLFCKANSVGAMIVGCVIYTIFHQDVPIEFIESHIYVYRLLRHILNFPINLKSPIFKFIHNHIGDFIWAYSVQMAAFIPYGKKLKPTIILMLFFLLSELITIPEAIYGTFDIIDIVSEWIGVWIARSFFSIYNMYTNGRSYYHE